MKKGFFFGLNVLGWMMALLALLMGAVYGVAANDALYFRLQMDADILDSAGISHADLRELDARLANYLFASMQEDMAFDNREIAVFGRMQPPFNARELDHLHDCRRLLSQTAPSALHAWMIVCGAAFARCGGKGGRRLRMHASWLAAALLIAPIAALGIWAAIDFSSAFALFHRILFTNDLWLLDPQTDLLIRICPQSMFRVMGARIGLGALAALLGVPALYTLFYKLDQRKKEAYEAADL